MNIPWYKNKWYLAALGVVVFIFIIVYLSTENAKISIVNSGYNFNYLIELPLRLLFNPVWVLFLWCFNNGQRLNSAHHYDILKYLQGVTMSALDKSELHVLTSTLAAALVDYNNTEKKIRESLNSGVSMKDDGGSPKI
ncbi:MAG: hypothetical protein WCO55_00655 [Candidatus Falkowbacteria bacterium]